MIRPLADRRAFAALLERPQVLLYKHSPVCWQSLWTLRHIKQFAGQHPRTPVYQVDVVAQRELCEHIADHLGVRHESPQAILLRRGAAVWSASHFGVRAAAVARVVEPAG